MMAKDLGMYLYEQHKGTTDPPVWLMPNFTFFKLAVIESDLFSSTVNTEIGGEPYAMTVDFDRLMFNKLMACIPEYYADQIRDFVYNNDEYPFIIQLDQKPIQVDIRVRLGELQHGQGEDFISMIVMDISPPEK